MFIIHGAQLQGGDREELWHLMEFWGKAEGDAGLIEDSRLGSLCLLLNSRLYYVLYDKHIYRYLYLCAYNCIILQVLSTNEMETLLNSGYRQPCSLFICAKGQSV